MAEIPLPSLETLGKISGWVTQQATTWLQVVNNPKDFASKIDLTSPAELGRSVQFLVFVVLCTLVLGTPIDALRLHFHVFDATTQICQLLFMALQIVIFSFSIYLFGKLIRGKGECRSTLTAMFYSAALYPLGLVANYLMPDTWTNGIESGSLASVIFSAFYAPFQSLMRDGILLTVGVVIIAYIVSKLVPLIRFLHPFGTIRALLVIWLASLIDAYYTLYVVMPLVPDLVKP